MCRPADAEVVAAGGQLADEVGESFVVGVATGFGAEDPDGVVGDRVPVEVEVQGLGVQEDEPDVEGPGRLAELVGVEASPSWLAARTSSRPF